MKQYAGKVAIVHDWMIGGGAEQVVEQLHIMFPEAPIYTSYVSPEWRRRMPNAAFKTGFLQYLPSVRKFLPVLRILWFTSLNFKKYDLVISSSGAEAKGIKTFGHTTHINYCHAPTHYYWSRYNTYLQDPGFGSLNWLARLGLKILVGPLRKWDRGAAQRPDFIIANSMHTQAQVLKYYGRESTVIHPPVDTERFGLSSQDSKSKSRHGFIITGRQVHYKRIYLAVEACAKLGLPLKVIGSGPEHDHLKALAGPIIEFFGHIPHDDMPAHLQTAQAFIFPGLDDFGIAPVEAMAAGTPVIAFKAGGALDYITPKTGMFFDKQTVESLVACLESFDINTFKPEQIQVAAQQFSIKEFRTRMQQNITQLTGNFVK